MTRMRAPPRAVNLGALHVSSHYWAHWAQWALTLDDSLRQWLSDGAPARPCPHFLRATKASRPAVV
jgi:hypothetical protein